MFCFLFKAVHETQVKLKKNDSGIVVHNAIITSNPLSFTTLDTHCIVYKVIQYDKPTILSQSADPYVEVSNKEDESIVEEREQKEYERKKSSKSRQDLGKKLTSDKSVENRDKGKAKTNEMRLLQKEAHR